MENYHIKETDQSPEVILNSDGFFSLNGISTPDHVNKFYNPIFDWLKEFGETNPKKIEFSMFINYLNTSSTRILVELLMLVNSFEKNGTEIKLTWKYEEDDEDILELGEELQMVSGVEFIFVSVPTI